MEYHFRYFPTDHYAQPKPINQPHKNTMFVLKTLAVDPKH